MLWENKRFLLCGFEKEEIDVIKECYIEKYSGKLLFFSINDEVKDSDIDYVVCNYSNGYIRRVSNVCYCKLRTPFWLWLSVKDQWNYSLDWHPFFRANGRFTYDLLSGIQIYIVGFTPTIKGILGEKTPVFIRDVYDMGILSSFIETQMGGIVENIQVTEGNAKVCKDNNTKNEIENNRDKIAIVCTKNFGIDDNGVNGGYYCENENADESKNKRWYNAEDLIEIIKEKEERGYQILKVDWLFDCYEEGRLINYRNYIFRYEESVAKNSQIAVANHQDNADRLNTTKIVITQQTYLSYIAITENMTREFQDRDSISIIIDRPSRAVLSHIQESCDIMDKKDKDHKETLVLVFIDNIEEQEFWYDLLNIMTDNIEFNVNLVTGERKRSIRDLIEGLRIINDPNEFFHQFNIKIKGEDDQTKSSRASFLGKKVGFSIPKFIHDLLKLETEILDTVLNMTDFDAITGLSGFVEYASDDTLDIVKYNKNKAVKKFNAIEDEFNTCKNRVI